MARDLSDLDAHEQPAPKLKAIWKAISRTDQDELLAGSQIDDPRDSTQAAKFCQSGIVPAENIARAWQHIGYASPVPPRDVPIMYHPLVPGLRIVMDLIPVEAQRILINRVVHRDLSNVEHKTNLHLHYDIPYPELAVDTCTEKPELELDATNSAGRSASFFHYSPSSEARFTPKDPAVHKPLSIQQVLNRRLSWMTLGGQFDWTNRTYPGTVPPDFPQDLGNFLHEMFPETVAQAAIVNFYTPGDTMMMHRDVSEKTDRGLVSLSIGCDSLFMIAPSNVDWDDATEAAPNSGLQAGALSEKAGKKFLLLKIRSGDVVYMTEESRCAWHGVPKVLRGSCPEALQDWPAQERRGESGDGSIDEFEEWRGWLRNKRININVRQME
ncbi:alkylated DNA repair protein AlkB [Ceratocystis lukuohia]|uniref:Alkylated DNA repair protein AlkB n=1 Tax=Ceratocystis lukuohia TaxID=2019550 RepID=A0ABR4MR75_9PEZI